MYEARYAKYFTQSQARFAEPEEMIREASRTLVKGACRAGLPLYYEPGSYYLDGSDAHSLVVGPTGCKKSRVTVFPTVRSIIRAGESAVINDPKGEIYRQTAGAAKAAGAQVLVLNFRDPKRSCGWNPLLQAYDYHVEGLQDEAQQSLSDFATSVMAPSLEKTVENYWGITAATFLRAGADSLMDSVPRTFFHLKNLIPLMYEENYRLLKEVVKEMNPTSAAAFGLHAVVDLEADRTRSCIYSTLLAALAPFMQNRALLDMLSGDSFPYSSITERQTLVYLIYPDEKNTLNFLVNLFCTQCYEGLVFYAAAQPEDRLPRRVNFVLDEFSNLTPIDNFANRISEARSKNIRYFLFIQSYGQLKEKYGDHADTILSNCGNWIIFSSRETEFLEKVSAICGKEADFQGREHPLISAFELQHFRKALEGAEVLIIKQGQYPFVTALPDYDYQSVFPRMEAMPLTEGTSLRKGRQLTPLTWFQLISQNTRNGFRYPYKAGRLDDRDAG